MSVRRRLGTIGAMVLLSGTVAVFGGSSAPAGAAKPAPPAVAGPCAGVSEPSGSPRDNTPISATLLRQCLRLNQIQVMGTHNSYRQATTPQILAALQAFDPVLASELEYEHPPLHEQFENQAIRQIELDIFADPEGGLYAARIGLSVVGLPNDPPPELFESGYKTLHIQDLDFNTWCTTLVICLEQVRDWSDDNLSHLPLAILVELKTSPIPDPFNFGFVVPVPVGGPELDALDDEIRSVFSEERMITPDDVRGSYPSLEAAVRDGAWPTLQESAGKVLFLMDNAGGLRNLYRAGRPSLEGRVLFTNAVPGADDAAFVKVNEPQGNEAFIQQLVADGYVVRTRSDTPTVQARSGDTTRRESALASGAQWVSTDYPVPGSSPFSDYFAAVPGGNPARCNPINTGPRCFNGLLETGVGSSRSFSR
jgi:hypothetical protein